MPHIVDENFPTLPNHLYCLLTPVITNTTFSQHIGDNGVVYAKLPDDDSHIYLATATDFGNAKFLLMPVPGQYPFVMVHQDDQVPYHNDEDDISSPVAFPIIDAEFDFHLQGENNPFMQAADFNHDFSLAAMPAMDARLNLLPAAAEVINNVAQAHIYENGPGAAVAVPG